MLCKNRIGEYLKVQGGFAFKSSSYQESGIPIIRISNITDRGIILDNICVSTDIMEQTSGYLAEINDSLIAMSGATTGKMGLVSAKNLPALINQRVGRFVYIKNSDKRYFYQLSLSNEFQRQVEINAMGGAQPNISPQKIENIELYIEINTDEQSKIANILSTCDEVIEKTEETIEKYKQIKVGMMQDLFTRGLDENGKLRPTYAQSPDLYKYSEELDRYIPKEWDVTTLLDCCTKPCSYGINAQAVDFDTSLPLYLRITDITEDGKYNKQGRKCVNSVDASKYILEPNDIVFARTGATVGKTYLYDINDGQLVYAGFLICFSLDSSMVDSYFIKIYAETDYYLNWVTVYSQRSGQPGINGNEYSKMLLAKPKRKEQEKIGIIFKKIDEKISYEKDYRNKYRQIKQGLMKRLLTPPADAEIVEE